LIDDKHVGKTEVNRYNTKSRNIKSKTRPAECPPRSHIHSRRSARVVVQPEDLRLPARRRYVGHVHVDDARGNSDHHDQPGANSDRSTFKVRTQVHTQPQPAAADDSHRSGAPDDHQQIRYDDGL